MCYSERELFHITIILEPIVNICSNHRVAQNGMFVMKPIYIGGDNMVDKVLDFRLSESLKCTLQDLLLSQIIPRKLNFALSLREFS